MSEFTSKRVKLNQLRTHASIGERLRLVGQAQMNGPTTLILSSPEASVTVMLQNPVQLSSQVVEVIGVMQQDGTLRDEVVTPFSQGFDVETYEQMLSVMDKAPELF